MTEDADGAVAGGDTGEGFDEALEDPVDERRRRGLAGATVWMAVGTTLSRVTGLGRLFALAAALGQGGLSDGYNIANTTPNIITDIVVGGVLSATFVPVFVDRLGTRARKEAWRAISAVVTVTIVVLAVSTVAFWILTPAIIHLYTSANHNPDVHQQQQVAITLLRLFVPQLACYGLIALFTALLNTRQRFAAPMFVPIANNLVVIGVSCGSTPSSRTPHWPRSAPIRASSCCRHRHDPRGRGPGRPPRPLPRSGRPARPLPVGADPRGHADHRPAGRVDLRSGAGQPDRPGHRAGPGRRREGARGRCRPTPTPTPSSSSPTGSSPCR